MKCITANSEQARCWLVAALYEVVDAVYGLAYLQNKTSCPAWYTVTELVRKKHKAGHYTK
jgi:hypothetical protein